MPSLRRVLSRVGFIHQLRFAPYSLMYSALTRVLRVRANRTVFLSDSRADFSGNIEFLRREIVRQDPRAEIFGIFKPGLASRRPILDVLRLPWLAATAQTIVVDDYYPLIYPFQIRPESRLLQVWHAAGAFKRVGWSRLGLPGGPADGSLAHKNYTDATVSSQDVRADYAEAYGIDISRVKALGVPRTDVFFDAKFVASADRDVRDRYGIAETTKIALYAPTFRGPGHLTATFDYDCIDWDSLANELGDDWVVMVKMHPFVKPLSVARPGVTGIIDVTADREITQLLMAADVLVADYSSTIFEFALLERPVVFFCPDLQQYTADRDFYYPFEDYVTGPLVKEQSGLATAIQSARYGGGQTAFRERFLGSCDGHSSERITRELILTARDAARPEAAAPGGGSIAPTKAGRNTGLRLLVAHTARIALNLVYFPLRALPRRRKIVMISREHETEPEDFLDLRAALQRADPSVDVVTLVRMVPPGYAAKVGYATHMLAQLYHVATAQVLVVDTYAMVASLLRHGRGLTVIQIWHALGAFKKFGLSILDHPEGRDRRLASAMRMHQGYDVVLASGEACEAAYTEAFGVSPDRIMIAPLPRVDRLLDPTKAQRTRTAVFDVHPRLRDARVAVYAPTFRIDGSVATDPIALSAALQEAGIHLVVKLHPLMPHDFGPEVDVAPGFSTQELLQVADIFITDYSSALYEAAILAIPTYFLAPDLAEYAASRDFYLDYRSELPGPIVQDAAQLVAAIAAGTATRTSAREFGARWVQVPEGSTATACADAIAARVLASIEHGRQLVAPTQARG